MRGRAGRTVYPLPLMEGVARIVRCETGEGFSPRMQTPHPALRAKRLPPRLRSDWAISRGNFRSWVQRRLFHLVVINVTASAFGLRLFWHWPFLRPRFHAILAESKVPLGSPQNAGADNA